MPRRNVQAILLSVLIAIVCYQKTARTERSPHRDAIDALIATFDEIDRSYLEAVEPRELFEGAMNGLVGELDEYSSYIEPQGYQELSESLEQEFGGIGIQLGLDPKSERLMVMSPLVGSPAYKAGIQSGDLIVAIEGERTDGFKLEDAVVRLKGPAGKKVSLTLERPGQAEPLEYQLTRATIQTDSVLGDSRGSDDSWNFMLQGHPGIGYIRLTTFSQRTAVELRDAMQWLQDQHARGVILDLRGNPGGLLKSAVDVCNLFVPHGRIVSIRGRGGEVLDEYEADGRAPFPEIPIVVLVNRYSASASEIVAACLEDHGRAIVVGSRTWGKGSVQNVISLVGGREGALKLTTASYWRPSGANIHRGRDATDEDQWGVLPSPGYEVDLSDDAWKEIMEWRRKHDVVTPRTVPGAPANPDSTAPEDPVLNRAVEYLKQRSPAPQDQDAAVAS
jgi:carboxyl-terminal processing protease